MKRKYLGWRQNLININERLTRKDVIEWCCNGWKYETLVSSELIKQTFN